MSAGLNRHGSRQPVDIHDNNQKDSVYSLAEASVWRKGIVERGRDRAS